MEKTRNYGIDLLRMLLMYMVCMLHTLGQGGILAACDYGSLKYCVFLMIRTMSEGAVDGFALITGYMAANKPAKFEKLVSMWFQAFFYSFVITVILFAFRMNGQYGMTDLVKAALPLTFKSYWYFSAFFVMYLAAPILNKFLFAADENTLRKTMVVMVVLFTIIGLIKDTFEAQYGYSAIWLMALYCIGVMAKRTKLFESRKSVSLILLWLICIVASWLITLLTGVEKLLNYTSPTIMLSALLLVILFSRVQISGKIIGKITPFVFGIYLFQLNRIIFNNFLKDAFSFAADKNIVLSVLYAVLFALMIFAAGLVMDMIRSAIARFLRIPALSSKIIGLIDSVLNKAILLLK